VTDLRENAARLQHQFREDLAGAHQAWHGACPCPRPSPQTFKPSLRAGEPPGQAAPKTRRKKR
jgi:hypothetical protein